MADNKPIEPGYSNAFWNILKPVMGGGKLTMGAAEYVTIETLVGQIIRKVMKVPTNIGESVELHTYSLPFLGQLNFGDEARPYELDKKVPFKFVEEATQGAKHIPAAIVGYSAMRVRRDGLRVPAYANRDFLYMLVGKILSRPVTQFIFQSLPDDFQLGLVTLQALADRQQAVIKSIAKPAGD